jgi:hypothetical protein
MNSFSLTNLILICVYIIEKWKTDVYTWCKNKTKIIFVNTEGHKNTYQQKNLIIDFKN